MPERKNPRTRRTYTSEFKQQIVDLYHSGKRKCYIIREYDIASSLLDKWIARLINPALFMKKITAPQSSKNFSNFAKKTNACLWKMIF